MWAKRPVNRRIDSRVRYSLSWISSKEVAETSSNMSRFSSAMADFARWWGTYPVIVPTWSFSALNRQCSDSFLRRCVDRVAQRRGYRRQRGFTDSRGRFLAWNRIDLHCRGLVHAQRGVVVEVALHDAALSIVIFARSALARP